MTNDAKLGMLAGVLGVIVAAVLFTNAPPPAAQSQPGAPEPAKPAAALTAGAPVVRSEGAALASTPVARTRKEAEGQSTSRAGGADEEP